LSTWVLGSIVTSSRLASWAIAALAYSACTFLAMALFGVERWIDRGEAFSVYFNLFSRISPLERRGRRIGLRPPLAGLATLAPQPGTVALFAVMLGATTFDGATSGPLWANLAPELIDTFRSLGAAPGSAVELASSVGLAATVLGLYGFYRLGIAGARSVGGRLGAPQLLSGREVWTPKGHSTETSPRGATSL
jgi:hypothetical protein